MILNGVMALILRYFMKFGSFRGALRKNVRERYLRKKVHVHYFLLAMSLAEPENNVQNVGP